MNQPITIEFATRWGFLLIALIVLFAIIAGCAFSYVAGYNRCKKDSEQNFEFENKQQTE